MVQKQRDPRKEVDTSPPKGNTMKKILNALILASTMIFAGCDEESPYSGYRVNFTFDSTIHPYNQARSFGQYICVRRGRNVGEYRLTDALGNTQDVNIPQINLQQNTFHYGLGGLIIGTPSAYGEGNLVAYDWACPKCQIQSARVTIDYTMGHALCPKCATKFDLNSGGIPIEGESRPLWRYRIFDSGSNVIIQN